MKSYLFKLLALFIVMSSFVVVGFGCKGVSTTEAQATRAVNLVWWTVNDDVGALQTSIAGYRATRSFVNVTVRQYGENEIYDRLVEALAEDKGPDILSVSNKELYKYLSKLSSMPVSTLDTTMVVNKGQFSEETIINSQTVSLPSTRDLDKEYVKTVKEDAVVGGKIYGLPLSLDTMALYYNKDLLDRAGVPEPPLNWDEFQEAVKKITKFNFDGSQILQSGTALGTGANITHFDDLTYLLFAQSGVDFVNDSGLAVFNYYPSDAKRGYSPAMNVFKFYADFADPTRDTYAWNADLGNDLNRFASGAVGFYFGYAYDYPRIKARAPQLNLEILPMLQLNSDDPVNVASYSLECVTAKSTHKNEAWNLINYLTRTQFNKKYLDATGRPTALRGFIASQLTDEKLSPFASQVLIAENWYKGRNYRVAKQALLELYDKWNKPVVDNNKIVENKSIILNTAASKFNQTL